MVEVSLLHFPFGCQISNRWHLKITIGFNIAISKGDKQYIRFVKKRNRFKITKTKKVLILKTKG
jgi:hypothetical protein